MSAAGVACRQHCSVSTIHSRKDRQEGIVDVNPCQACNAANQSHSAQKFGLELQLICLKEEHCCVCCWRGLQAALQCLSKVQQKQVLEGGRGGRCCRWHPVPSLRCRQPASLCPGTRLRSAAHWSERRTLLCLLLAWHARALQCLNKPCDLVWHSSSVNFPPLSSRSETVCLASSGLLHTHLALADMHFTHYC